MILEINAQKLINQLHQEGKILKQEILNSKKQVLEKFALMQTFKAIWSEDQQSNQFKLMMEGTLKGETMQKSGLTEADWKRIATMLENTVKSIKDDMKDVKSEIHTLKTDMKNVKENINEINHRLDRIENCPTIKKELK